MRSTSGRNENLWKSSSPCCSVVSEYLIVRPSMRTGVPVFMRSVAKPNSRNCSVIPWLAGSEMRPPCIFTGPMCMSPLRNVPAVSTTALARNSTPTDVRTPHTTPSSMSRWSTESCHMYRLGVFSTVLRHSSMKRIRSACARGLHMAGPLLRLSIRNCIEARSVTMPI